MQITHAIAHADDTLTSLPQKLGSLSKQSKIEFYVSTRSRLRPRRQEIRYEIIFSALGQKSK